MMALLTKIDKPQKVSLKKFDPADTQGWSKDKTIEKNAELLDELRVLQEWMYAAATHSLLIVLQGMDTSGKDGSIEHVMSTANPQGCAVAGFKVPTELERKHDFLWRVHAQAPAKGMITIFNRSHYEDVLVTRVHNLVDKKTIDRRYDLINDFEKLLAANSTIIIKFYLGISKDEQEKRLIARETMPEKAWKLSADDWKERQFWNEYDEAYEAALSVTGSEHAPWYLVPANHKWFRNLALAQTVVEALRPFKKGWEGSLKELGEQRLQEVLKLREGEVKK
jgi:PPK2 family polyphosphate:nucleotide phosphotransferase